MRKRAGLARALALDPELLFLDEPTAGLDPIGAAAFDELIKDLSDSLDLTVFMITHDLDSLYAITDRVAVLADKKVVALAPVSELERSDHPWIKEYFLGPRGARRAARRRYRPNDSGEDPLMERNANYALVGAVTLILFMGLVVFVVWLAKLQFNQEYDLYDILFRGPCPRPVRGWRGAFQRHQGRRSHQDRPRQEQPQSRHRPHPRDLGRADPRRQLRHARAAGHHRRELCADHRRLSRQATAEGDGEGRPASR
jgi:energy-coupling factor transporter ATP-binding protein EcfA2